MPTRGWQGTLIVSTHTKAAAMTNYHLEITHYAPELDPGMQKGVLETLSAHGVGLAGPTLVERNNPYIIAFRGRNKGDNWWEAVDAASKYIHRTTTVTQQPWKGARYIRVSSVTPVADRRSTLIEDIAVKFSQGKVRSDTYICGQGSEEAGQQRVSGRITDLAQPILLNEISLGIRSANKARKALFGSGAVDAGELLDHLGVPTSVDGGALLDSGYLRAILKLGLSLTGRVPGHPGGVLAVYRNVLSFTDWGVHGS